MTSACCRSTPRCAGCPVRRKAAARAARELPETAGLVTSILGGGAGRTLPPRVTAALEELDAVRSTGARRPLPAAARFLR